MTKEEKRLKILKPGVYLFLSAITAITILLLIGVADRDKLAAIDFHAVAVWILVAVLSESLSAYSENGAFFVSPIEAVFYAAYLSCGPLAAALSILITYLLIVTRDENRLRHIFNNPFRYTLFNIFHFMLIMLLLDRIINLFQRLVPSLHILPILAIAPLFFTLSCFLNAVFYKIEDDDSYRISFGDLFFPYYQTAYPASFAAVIIGLAYPRYGLLSIPIIITPLLVTLVTMKAQVRNTR